VEGCVLLQANTLIIPYMNNNQSSKQFLLIKLLNVIGIIYVFIEQFVNYPDDSNILGIPIDEDLQRMSRKNLCRYMDVVLPQKGFFDIQSTTKIRLGCQLLRNLTERKK
jgi:hypothetical protein